MELSKNEMIVMRAAKAAALVVTQVSEPIDGIISCRNIASTKNGLVAVDIIVSHYTPSDGGEVLL